MRDPFSLLTQDGRHAGTQTRIASLGPKHPIQLEDAPILFLHFAHTARRYNFADRSRPPQIRQNDVRVIKW